MKPIGKPIRFDISRTDDFVIDIAHYHRVALGLENGTSVYMAPVPPRDPSQQYIDEVILTTMRHDTWSRMHRLSLRLIEREGAVAHALKIIKDFANISIMESLTTDARNLHELLLYIDLEAAKRPRLEEVISNELKLSLYSNTLPAVEQEAAPDDVFIQPLHRLHECAAQVRESHFLPQAEIRDKKLVCRATEFRGMFNYKGMVTDGLTDRVLIFSDTEEKYIQFFFPRENDNLLRISVVHHERQGAIFSFSDAVRLNGANILSSYSRLQSAGNSAQWKAIIDVPENVTASGIISDIAKCSGFYDHIGNVELSYNRVKIPIERRNPGYNTSGPSSIFFGRTYEQHVVVSSLHDAISSKYTHLPYFILQGFSGAGKTTLINKLGSVSKPVFS